MRPLFYGDEENRTPDPLRAKQVLSQLSYTPVVSSKLNNYTSLFPSLTSDSSDISFFQCHFLLRKEVIQPHLPIRLPCYDFTPVINPTFDDVLQKGLTIGFGYYRLPWCDGRCVQGPGTYSPQHSDLRLLAIPTSYRRVAACNLNWDNFLRFAPPRGLASLCLLPL